MQYHSKSGIQSIVHLHAMTAMCTSNISNNKPFKQDASSNDFQIIKTKYISLAKSSN